MRTIGDFLPPFEGFLAVTVEPPVIRGTCAHHGVVTVVWGGDGRGHCPGGPEGLGCSTSMAAP